jgi:hypothetical protein
MSEAIRNIADSLVRLKDRAALERMREHRNTLLQNYRMHSALVIRVEALEKSLQGDLDALADALARLP